MAAEAVTTSTRPVWARQLLCGRDPVGAWPNPARIRDGWQAATVSEVIAKTPDTVTLRLALTDSQPFLPGQHFDLEVPAGDAYPAVETYSASSSPWPDPRVADVTVKEVPGGRVSPLLVRRIPIGAILWVR